MVVSLDENEILGMYQGNEQCTDSFPGETRQKKSLGGGEAPLIPAFGGIRVSCHFHKIFFPTSVNGCNILCRQVAFLPTMLLRLFSISRVAKLFMGLQPKFFSFPFPVQGPCFTQSAKKGLGLEGLFSPKDDNSQIGTGLKCPFQPNIPNTMVFCLLNTIKARRPLFLVGVPLRL